MEGRAGSRQPSVGRHSRPGDRIAEIGPRGHGVSFPLRCWWSCCQQRSGFGPATRASRLVDPDALKLDPQSPQQLVGRREDLDKLLNALANPLVFLVSESGCGKSALLRAGYSSDLDDAYLDPMLVELRCDFFQATESRESALPEVMSAAPRSSLQHILNPDRQAADADTRRVIDRVRNSRRRSDVRELAEAFDAGRVHIVIFLRYQNDLD
jgi:hypothetical protein